MPRTPGKVPSYCHHKASGRAVVRIDGRDHYLGQYGCDDSHAEYQRLIALLNTTTFGTFTREYSPLIL